MITKKQALAVFKTEVSLARQLNISRGAVNQWKPESPIPLLQEFKLRTMLPNIFGPPTEALETPGERKAREGDESA